MCTFNEADRRVFEVTLIIVLVRRGLEKVSAPSAHQRRELQTSNLRESFTKARRGIYKLIRHAALRSFKVLGGGCGVEFLWN